MSAYTKHYQLHQWDPQDPFLRTDFNQDLSKIDTALGTLSATATELGEELNLRGNCQICFQTYVGTGTYGNSKPNTLTFPGKPLVLLVRANDTDGRFIMALQGAIVAHTTIYPDNWVTLSWSDNSVSWYHYSRPEIQMNNIGTTYFVVALIDLGDAKV